MNKYLYLLFLAFAGSAFGQGIEFFDGSWDEALVKAKEEEKIIFIDAYTTWCGPCKMMASKVFTQEPVGEYFNSSFINMKMDMEKEKGMKWGMKYPVSAYPTLYFVNDKGDVVKKSVGAKQVEDLITLGKEAIASDDRSADYAALFEDGERDYDMVLKYVKELNKVGKSSLAVANTYLREKPQITQEQKAVFLMEAASQADSKLFDQLLDLKSEAIAATSKVIFEEKVEKACKKTVDKAIEYEYESLLNEAVEKMKKAIPSKADEFEFKALMSYAKAFQSYDDWYKHAKKYFKKSGKSYSTYSNLIADVKYFYKENDNAKEEMYKWYDELIKCTECSDQQFIEYAQLLSQNGEHKKAIEVATVLLERTKSEGKNTSRIEHFINYLEKQS